MFNLSHPYNIKFMSSGTKGYRPLTYSDVNTNTPFPKRQNLFSNEKGPDVSMTSPSAKN